MVKKSWNNGKKKFVKKPSKKIEKEIKKVVKAELKQEVEHKYFDTTNLSVPSWNGTIIDLSAIPIGTSSTTRIGNKIQPISTRLAMEIIGPNAVGSTYCEFRYIIFRWKPDSVPTAANIISVIGSNQTPHAPLVVDQRDQFTVIKDKLFNLSAALSGFTTESSFQSHIINKRVRRPVISFDSAATTGSNKLYLLFISDGTIQIPSIYYYNRLIYTDA